MKKIIILFALLFSIANSNAQRRASKDILVGKITVDALKVAPYDSWFTTNYNNYTPDPEVIRELKKVAFTGSITIFMGTWCDDSHNQVPAFYKVLDQIGFDTTKVTLIAVDKNKKTPEGLENKLNIFKVPMFIFKFDEEESKRIVETPVESLEKDMLKIISGKRYVGNYMQ